MFLVTRLFNRCRANVEDSQKEEDSLGLELEVAFETILLYTLSLPNTYPTCRSVMAGLNDSEIPHCLYSALLPHPDMSILDFLSFELPAQFNSLFGIKHINIQEFWSKALPICINLESHF